MSQQEEEEKQKEVERLLSMCIIKSKCYARWQTNNRLAEEHESIMQYCCDVYIGRREVNSR